MEFSWLIACVCKFTVIVCDYFLCILCILCHDKMFCGIFNDIL